MRRRRAVSRKPAKAQQTIKAKHGVASKAARNRRPPALLRKDTEVTRLARERDELRLAGEDLLFRGNDVDFEGGHACLPYLMFLAFSMASSILPTM